MTSFVSRLRLRWDIGGLFALAVALPTLLPLWQPGFLDSHDGTLHLYRVMSIDRALQQGVLFPRLLPEMSFGYGYPLLNYYPPLSYYVVEAFHILGFGYIVSMKLALGAAFLLAALGMYLLAREFFGRWPGVFAAAIYTYVPYHLADGHMRGAIAELWAFVFLPLLFLAFFRLVQEPRPAHFLAAAGAFAALMLTHNLTAFIAAPFLAVYVAYLALRRHEWRGIFLSFGSSLLGLGLAAFYWLPAEIEMKAVHVSVDGLHDLEFLDRLTRTTLGEWISTYLPYRYFPKQGVLSEHPVSVVQLALIGLALVALWRYRHWRRGPVFPQVVFFLFLTAASCFMQLSYSKFVWDIFYPLQYIQFPWRFLALTALATAVVAGAAVAGPGGGAKDRLGGTVAHPLKAAFWQKDGLWWRGPLAFIALFALVGVAWPNLPTKTLDMRESDVTMRAMSEHDVKNGQMGASWSGEFVPIDVTEDRGQIPWPVQQPREDVTVLPPGVSLEIGPQQPWARHFQTDLSADTRLLLHTFYFPGWQAYIDGRPQAVYPATELGLLAVDVPAGPHSLVLRFEDTAPRKVGNLLTEISVATVALALLFAREKRVFLVLLAGVVLLGGALFWHSRGPSPEQTPSVVNARLGDTALLLGYATDRQAYHPGDTAKVTLYWLALRDPQQDYQVYVHLANPADEAVKVGQHDGVPGDGFTPTTRWFAGEIVEDTHEIAIGPDTAAGDYRLVAGLYDLSQMQSLPVTDAQGNTQGGRVPLATIPVR